MLDVLDDLREKCPWDKKQTFESLRPNTIEETYELCDALAKNDMNNVCKELGDVLMHTAFYALLASEKGEFDIADVCNREADKLIFRHPHIYGDVQADNEEQVLKNWEQLKLQEKDGNETVLSGVPDALPSVIKAYRIQDKARNVGFDWKEKNDVWAKVREELDELETELKREDKEKSTQELTLPPQSRQRVGANQPKVHQKVQLCGAAFYKRGQAAHRDDARRDGRTVE